MSNDLLNSINKKVDKISEDVGEIKIIAAKHDENLKEHMRRTSALEDLYTHLDEDKIGPLQRDMSRMIGAYQLLVILGILASIALTVIEYFKK